MTSAVYRIIFGQGEVNNGTITIEEIRRILSEKGSPELSEKGIPCLDGVSYSNEECRYVLEIMRKFKVSYRVSPEKEFIPALCNENTPKDLVPEEREYWGSGISLFAGQCCTSTDDRRTFHTTTGKMLAQRTICGLG